LSWAGWLDDDGWHPVGALPQPRYKLAAAALGPVAYLSGGSKGGGLALDTFESYDARTGRWRSSRRGPDTSGRADAPPLVIQQTRPSVAAPEPPMASAGKPRPEDFALIVGVENYRSVMRADYGERDAATIRKLFTERLGVPPDNVITLTGERATHTDIAKYIEEWLPRNVTKDSRVYFFYSGHGAPDPERGTSYLLPWDGDPDFLNTSGYPLARLYEKLAALPAKDVVAMIDSCFSGSGGRSVIGKGLRPLVTVMEAPVPRSGRLTVLTAASGGQVASSSSERQHGLFTYEVIQGLLGGADADHDGHVDVSELYTYVHAQVRKAAHRRNREQDPQLRTSKPELRLY
jgi:hypothetical protein